MGKTDTTGKLSYKAVIEPPYQRADRYQLKMFLLKTTAFSVLFYALFWLGYYSYVITPQSEKNKATIQSFDTLITFYEFNESGQLVRRKKLNYKHKEKP